jgi:hypothetical protein
VKGKEGLGWCRTARTWIGVTSWLRVQQHPMECVKGDWFSVVWCHVTQVTLSQTHLGVKNCSNTAVTTMTGTHHQVRAIHSDACMGTLTFY